MYFSPNVWQLLSKFREVWFKVLQCITPLSTIFQLYGGGQSYSRFAITIVIVLESSYLFLTEGMYISGYITVNVTKRLKNCRISVDSMRSVFLFHILNDRNNWINSVFYIQRCSIFSTIGFAVKITDVNSDVCKIYSDFRSGIICFIFFYRGLS